MEVRMTSQVRAHAKLHSDGAHITVSLVVERDVYSEGRRFATVTDAIAWATARSVAHGAWGLTVQAGRWPTGSMREGEVIEQLTF